MTISGMKPVVLSDPHALGRRALLVALASGIGGVLWVIGDAAAPSHFAPLSPPPPPAAPLVPAAWALTPAAWNGLAGLPHRLGELGLQGPGFILALLFVALPALAVVHPGAFQRPPSYRLPRTRAVIACVSALLIGMALPASVLLLGSLIGPLSPFDAAGAMRVALGVIVFCAFLWTLAGQDIWHPRALVRFAHGGTAGFGIAASCALAVMLQLPLAPVADAGAAVAAIRDLGLGRPGATWGTVLFWRLVVLGFGFALAGAVAVMAGPQSVGSRPRAGAGVTAAGFLVLLLLAGWGAKRAGTRLTADLFPDVAHDLALTPGPARTSALLTGGGRIAVARRTVGHGAEAVPLYRECGVDGGQHPAPSPENVQRLESAIAATGGAVSVRASRQLACLAGLRALRFEPDLAAAVILGDSAPGRLPLAAFGAAVRGVVERSGAPASRRWLALLTDSTRFAGDADLRTRLVRLLGAPAESTATVIGTLLADAPTRWRVALVRGTAPGAQESPALYAPISDGQVLQYMAAATAPDAGGRFTLTGVAPGTYQVALLAPEGVTAEAVAALSVQGEPGQFTLLAGSRRDLGSLRLNR